MILFRGEYDIALDPKGRFLLPASFRKQLPEGKGDSFLLVRGFDGCLALYTEEVWSKIADNMTKMNDIIEEVRELKRMFLNATPVDVDSAGRVMIPKRLLEFAGIEKDLVMAANGNKMEIWAEGKYNERQIPSKVNAVSAEVANNIGNPFAI
jgi:MraZ protein